MTTSGEVGKSWLVGRDDGLYASNFVRILRPDPTIVDARFLWYLLRSESMLAVLSANTAGTTIANLKRSFFSEAQVVLPPLPVQRRLVAMLDETFVSIATAKANTHRVVDRSKDLLASVSDAALLPSGEEWETSSLADLCSMQRGLTYSKADERDAEGQVVLRATNVDLPTHSLDFSQLRYISNEVAVPDVKRVRRGSLLICTASGSKKHLGKVAYVDQDYGYAFGGFMGQLTPNGRVEPKFLFWVMTAGSYRRFIDGLGDGMNINNLNFDDLGRFPVTYPALPEQKRIADLLDAVNAEVRHLIETQARTLQGLEALEASMLHRAFSA